MTNDLDFVGLIRQTDQDMTEEFMKLQLGEASVELQQVCSKTTRPGGEQLTRV